MFSSEDIDNTAGRVMVIMKDETSAVLDDRYAD